MTDLSVHPDQQVFREHRNLLFSVAYRVLGSAADAEDAVQDAWIKWSAADRSQVADPKAYLGPDRVEPGAGTAALDPAQAGDLRGAVAAGTDPDRW
ncbi:sigma factor [Saccharopolyspora shandongensis]|uniref:sigma factor n=1 Tax=Saccharopolyspora shandongensis TaxID=418495 RepID=UPI00341D1E15